ncbi:MAG: cupredoxin domain-containing protein [Candidatus Andersenbacteria bacterium]
MSSTVIWSSLLVVIAIIVGGVLVVRSTTPAEEAFPSPTAVFDTEPDEFIQEDSLVVPPSALPSEGPSVSPTAAMGAASTAPAAPQAVRVAITDTGFSPASVTVPANTTVTFVNNGQGAHWPASDLHPTHDILPGFDARQGLTTGETYSFTFTQQGSWQYHDHLHPQFTGTVIVQ